MSEEKKIVYRTLAFDRAAVNEEDRTIGLSFSSEDAQVARYDIRNGEYFEVLGHNEGEIDTTFIGSGRAPLLLDHEPKNQIGVVQTVEVADGRARAYVKVSRSAAAQEIWQDIVDGIRQNVSVGYYVLQQREEGKKDGRKIVRATQWRPIEVSLVSIPADEGVGVGRSHEKTSDNQQFAETKHEEINMSEEKNVEVRAEPQLDLEKIKREAALSEQSRVREISQLGARFGMASEADEFIKNNKGADDFRGYVLENMKVSSEKTELNEERNDASVGMNDKEVKKYSMVRAIRSQLFPNDPKIQKDAAFERELSEAAAEKRGEDARGIIVPHDVLVRDLQATATNAGAEAVAEDLMAGSFIELLRNNMMVAALGANMMSGLRGNVAIPRQTGAATAYWLNPEGQAVTESTQSMDQVTLSPKNVGAFTDYSRQLLLQSSIDVEAFVRNDLASQLALAIDVAALYGTGAAGQPEGITTGVAKHTNLLGTTPTFGEVVGMESELATANALRGSLAYLTDFATKGGLKTTSKAGTEAIFVWDGSEMNGYRAEASSQVTSGDIFFCNWADLLIGMWGGLDLTVDPYSQSTTGNVRVVAFQSVDVARRHDASFIWTNDTP